MKEQTRIDKVKFENWLTKNGAEILPPTNEFELVRFKGKEIGVLYKSGKTSNLFTADAISCFIRNKKWEGKPVNVGRKDSYKKEKVKLLERDGDKCFLCDEDLGEDITLEHLLPLVSGGPNTLANMVLVHDECNRKLGVKPLHEKVKMAIDGRVKKLSELSYESILP